MPEATPISAYTMSHAIALFKKGELVTGDSKGEGHAEARVELIPFLTRYANTPFPYPYENANHTPARLSPEAINLYNLLLDQFLSADGIGKTIESWPSTNDEPFSVIAVAGESVPNTLPTNIGTRAINTIHLNLKIFESQDRAKSETYEISREIYTLRNKGAMAEQQRADETLAQQEAQKETQKLAALHPRFFIYPIEQRHQHTPGTLSCNLTGIRNFNAPADCPNAEAFVNAMREKAKGSMQLTANETELMGWLSALKYSLPFSPTPEPPAPPPSPAASAKGAPPHRHRH